MCFALLIIRIFFPFILLLMLFAVLKGSAFVYTIEGYVESLPAGKAREETDVFGRHVGKA